MSTGEAGVYGEDRCPQGGRCPQKGAGVRREDRCPWEGRCPQGTDVRDEV